MCSSDLGGTASQLEEHGVPVTRVEEVTSAPEMLAGRVKTLHPRIHAGILARRDIPEDMDALDDQDIEPFDLVCVNLYPFASVAGRQTAATCAKFFAAARSIDGPPTSIISIASSSVTPSRAATDVNG